MSLLKPVALFVLLVFVTGCSWFVSRPEGKLTTALDEALAGQPLAEQGSATEWPLQVHYEIRDKAVINRELEVRLEIKTLQQAIAELAYAVVSDEEVELLEPRQQVSLGQLEVMQRLYETLRLKPKQEGLFNITVYLAISMEGADPVIKSVQIPISVGRFQPSRREPESS